MTFRQLSDQYLQIVKKIMWNPLFRGNLFPLLATIRSNYSQIDMFLYSHHLSSCIVLVL